ncbi:MAG TPA: c-type cytochrome [Pseudolabrys sp.]|nr:c-type cytochrome [Pseudolabrys sp.]
MSTKRTKNAMLPKALGLLLCSAAITLAATASPQAQNAAPPAVTKAALDAKLHYCKTCHGVSGQGFRGYYPIPRLAGQQEEYLLNQVHAFIEHRRTNNIMFNVAHELHPGMAEALAKSFHELNPKPLGGAPKALVADGKKIFDQGVAGNDIPACATCHGADAKGDGQFPRLAGQLHDYVFNKLTHWRQERGQSPSDTDPQAIMEPIAHGLTQAQIKAVAAYVSTLE